MASTRTQFGFINISSQEDINQRETADMEYEQSEGSIGDPI